ncbi:YhcH/YjgK/YiaL family protein [Staphylococcus lutrae]|uniref:Beta-D-galactosidase n=1 Tax=Staphylococcus lutrae TaxID=155085 RepID=A0AAC9RTP4_9STAP|nr:YhcH/YjgK/YiaL family protein [Staphylococcus lutrae]ARJ51619.1 beta-D-galactosidase [Staphylococcus lutrae]PNZ36737.1 YhcH/YjgK/YiaL family protein [Staphylococcus lutrae]
MIIAERKDFKRYVAINPHFHKVNDFLANTDLSQLEEGRIDIDGDNVFANCMTYVADGVAGGQFENHKKYIDIHLVIHNTEEMAVSALQDARSKAEFDVENDFELFDSDHYQIIKLNESNLLVTFEEDLHQPKVRVNDDNVKKLVIKVLN